MRHKLTLVWLCFLIRAGFYSIVFPIWEGIDEFGHFAMIQHLASRGEWGDPSKTRISREVSSSLKLVPLPWELKKFGPPHTTHEEYWSLPDEERARRQAELRRIPR